MMANDKFTTQYSSVNVLLDTVDHVKDHDTK